MSSGIIPGAKAARVLEIAKRSVQPRSILITSLAEKAALA